MTVSQSIESTVAAYLEREGLLATPLADLTPTTPLITSGLLDSMATLELLNFLEQEFQVQFEAYELTPEYMDTMSDIARLVQSKKS